MKAAFFQGFCLLELNTVIAIVVMPMLLTLPNFKQSMMRQERVVLLERLHTAIEYAKQEAFYRRKTITLCAIYAHSQECRSKDWSAGFILFEFNPRHKKTKQALHSFPPIIYGKLHFEQFGKHLNIEADGTTINVGTFIYCPHNKNPREAEALVINKAGRVYRVTARNKLGMLLKNAGTPEENPITCR